MSSIEESTTSAILVRIDLESHQEVIRFAQVIVATFSSPGESGDTSQIGFHSL